ncbi:Hypothetical predicted protein, partial [Olea europaea subsp. europaea]
MENFDLFGLLDDVYPWPRTPIVQRSPIPSADKTQPHVCSCITCGNSIPAPVIQVNAIVNTVTTTSTPPTPSPEVLAIQDVATTPVSNEADNPVQIDTIAQIVNSVATDINIKPRFVIPSLRKKSHKKHISPYNKHGRLPK